MTWNILGEFSGNSKYFTIRRLPSQIVQTSDKQTPERSRIIQELRFFFESQTPRNGSRKELNSLLDQSTKGDLIQIEL